MNNETEKNTNLKEAIIKVIAFFDMFDYPLTLNEIYLYLSTKCELNEVLSVLENIAWKFPVPVFIRSGTIEYKNGFYFLSGRDKIVEERLRRYNFTNRKFKRALFITKIFKFIPWIKMVVIGNLLGAHNLKDNGDIDLFIITENKRIWLTRFFCTSLIKFLGLRPQTNNSRDKICLSFYVSEEAMDLSSLMLKQKIFNSDSRGKDKKSEIAASAVRQPAERPPRNDKKKGSDKREDDIYFTYWLAGLTPLLDRAGTYEKFINSNWRLYLNLPNWRQVKPTNSRQVKSLKSEFYHDLADLFFAGLELQFKKFQLKLLPPELKNLMNQDSRVVINNQIIKLHANDRRGEYQERYLEKISKLL